MDKILIPHLSQDIIVIIIIIDYEDNSNNNNHRNVVSRKGDRTSLKYILRNKEDQ